MYSFFDLRIIDGPSTFFISIRGISYFLISCEAPISSLNFSSIIKIFPKEDTTVPILLPSVENTCLPFNEWPLPVLYIKPHRSINRH